MRRWASFLVLVTVIGTPSLIHAQASPEPPQPPPRSEPAAAPAARAPLFTGNHLGAYAAFSELPGLLFGFNHNALVFAGGLTFKYDGSGIKDSAGSPTGDRIASNATVSATALFYNIAPVGMGPGITYSTEIAPQLFQRHFVYVSMAFYFAPLPAPLVLVALLSSRLILEHDHGTLFELFTPSVLIGYLIH